MKDILHKITFSVKRFFKFLFLKNIVMTSFHIFHYVKSKTISKGLTKVLYNLISINICIYIQCIEYCIL